MKKFIAFLLIVNFICGCLPPGEPPAGNITANNVTLPKSRAEIRENVITELTAVLLTHGYGKTFQLDYDETSAADMLNVWHKCSKFTGIKRSENSPWKIISRNNNGQWTIKTVNENGVVSTISHCFTEVVE